MSVTSKIPNVVFLGLLVSLCLLSDRGFGTAETIIDTDPHVVLEVGTRGILPCRIQTKAYSVEWKRQLSSETETLVSLDTYVFVGTRDGPGYEAGLFNITDDYSLVIKDVKVQDEGLYICSVSDFKSGKLFRNSTRVSVEAFPDEPFPVIQECIGKDVSPGTCTLVAHATSNITCFVKGYYPDINLFFLHGSEKMTPTGHEEWNNADGTKNRDTTIQVSVSNEPYECVALKLPVTGGNRSVSVIVKAHSQGPNASAIVVPVIMVLLGCLTIAVIFKYRRRKSGDLSSLEFEVVHHEPVGGGMESCLRIPTSTEEYQRCDVRKKDRDIDKISCSWSFMGVIARYFFGKRVICTLYVTQPVTRGCAHSVLLCIHDDLLELNRKMRAQMREYKMLYPPKQLYVAWRSGDVVLTLFDCKEHPNDEVKVGEIRLSEKRFYQISCHWIPYLLESFEGERRLLKLVFYQGTSYGTKIFTHLDYGNDKPLKVAIDQKLLNL